MATKKKQNVAEQTDEKPKTYSSIGSWRAARSESWILPSGLQVETRKGISVLDLIEGGTIPDSLMGFFDMALSGNIELPTDESHIEADMLPKVMAAFNAMAKAALVNPRCTDQPTEDSLGVNELDYMDKAAIFERSQEGVNKVSSFRRYPGQCRGIGRITFNGESVRPQTVRVSWPIYSN